MLGWVGFLGYSPFFDSNPSLGFFCPFEREIFLCHTRGECEESGGAKGEGVVAGGSLRFRVDGMYLRTNNQRGWSIHVGAVGLMKTSAERGATVRAR